MFPFDVSTPFTRDRWKKICTHETLATIRDSVGYEIYDDTVIRMSLHGYINGVVEWLYNHCTEDCSENLQ